MSSLNQSDGHTFRKLLKAPIVIRYPTRTDKSYLHSNHAAKVHNSSQTTKESSTIFSILLFGSIIESLYLCCRKQEVMAIKSSMNRARRNRESKMIFASSCVESAARRRGTTTTEMYQRMKRVGLMDGFILKCYDALHTQSREHVTEDVLGALDIWESKMAMSK